MSRKLFSRSSRRQFLKLSSIFRKNRSRLTRRSLKPSKMLVSTNSAAISVNERIISWPSNDPSSHQLKSVDVHSKAISSVTHNDGRTKIESMLLEHWHEFFSSHLSRNALHRQIKQKALEIASKSDLKFKGSKKWLISFVKRCELLGYINVDVVNESNGLQANFRNTSFCSNAASSNNSTLSDGLSLPNISSLFSTEHKLTLPGQKPEADLFSQNLQPVVYITGDKVSCYKQHSTLTSTSISSEKDRTETVKNKFSKDNALLLRKNYGFMKDSKLFSRCFYLACTTGCKLTRNPTTTEHPSRDTPESIYDELFEWSEKNYAVGIPRKHLHADSNCKENNEFVSESVSSSDFLSKNVQASTSMQTTHCTNNTASEEFFQYDPLLHLFSKSLNKPISEAKNTKSEVHNAKVNDSSSFEVPVKSECSPDPLLNLFLPDHISLPDVVPRSSDAFTMNVSTHSQATERSTSGLNTPVQEKNFDYASSPETRLYSADFAPEPLSNELLHSNKNNELLLDLSELFAQPLNISPSDELIQEDVEWIDSLFS